MSRAAVHATRSQVRATYKARDSWWTVLLVDPLVGPLVRLAAARPWCTPDRLTGVAFLLGVAAAAAFSTGAGAWLAAGAVAYHLGFVVDCMDGKLARLTGTGSVRGGWLDFLLDRLRVMLCTVALFTGLFVRTDHAGFLFAAIAVVFLGLFGYVSGAETDKARKKLGPVPDTRDSRDSIDDTAVWHSAAGPAAGVLQRVRAGLHRHRIRMNLVSAVEFEMAVLVIGPLAAAVAGPFAVLWVTGVAATLVLVFELALILRFWLIARSTERAAGRDMPGSPSHGAHPTVPVQRGHVEQKRTSSTRSAFNN